VLGKIHVSVRGLGERLKEIETNKGRRYKQVKKRLGEREAECQLLRA